MNITVNQLAEGAPGDLRTVLVHGLEDSWESWLPLARRLPAGWRVDALDLPWRPGNDYRWRHRPAGVWLAHGLDLLDGVPDLVVAHSFGANATLELLCTGGPWPVRAAVLVCPLYRPPEVALTWKVFDRSRRAFDQHMREGLLARLGPRAATVEPDVLEKMTATAIDRVGPAAFLTVFDRFSASTSLPLARVTQPILLLGGGADPTLSRAAVTALAAAIPRASVVFQDRYDHFCHVRHAAEVAVEVAEWIADFVPAAHAVTPDREGVSP
jgi:pimeloyl-ACP methyl ester carboxylesterase